ncbi:hypothetical protein SARC_08519 [Sphaeroforma arctica JP610]|uniref:Uncharacterized protein n=1 Tax=Sphaeroforma arctica JP610 TaxID=667725 RepID=A0A0L0FQW6_9EUKA|nr:hypothetical protein SARC_08519 [Sphaeroforma arctica JP610]KNC79074.1 hypothetical protein SARC_08519 [Sphaeroforma arctica JP610]|eukprot:XP_014152976.1 hypothetical protein SARC_08519 [Sphaeroforma arctica JP610]
MKFSLLSMPMITTAAAFTLLLVASWTRVWVNVDNGNTPGVVFNGTAPALGTPGYLYPSHFGLWTGCYDLTATGEQWGCAFISGACNTNICWWVGNTLFCSTDRYDAIDSCGAYVSARVFITLALIALVVAMVMLASGLKYAIADHASVGCLWATLVFLSITCGTFVGGVYKGTGVGPNGSYSVQDEFSLDWSFILFGIAFGMTFVAAVVTTALALVVEKHQQTVDEY